MTQVGLSTPSPSITTSTLTLYPKKHIESKNEPMETEKNEPLVFYPAFCFKASPTHFTWVKIGAADVHRLRKYGSFVGMLPLFAPGSKRGFRLARSMRLLSLRQIPMSRAKTLKKDEDLVISYTSTLALCHICLFLFWKSSSSLHRGLICLARLLLITPITPMMLSFKPPLKANKHLTDPYSRPKGVFL